METTFAYYYFYIIQEKRLEYNENKEKLDYIIETSDELSVDMDTHGHYTINDDVQLLERDFQGVKTELDRLDGLLSKGMWYKKIHENGTTGKNHFFDLVKKLKEDS